MAMNHPTRTFSLACCLIVGLMVPSIAKGPPPALVRVGLVQKQSLEAHWDVVGRLVEIRRSVVAAERGGKIIALHVEEGDVVVAGKTVLAQIDDVWAKLKVRQAQAALMQTKASVTESQALLDQAKRDLAYYKDLLAKQSARPKEVQDSQTQVQAAEARLDHTIAQEAQAQADLELTQTEIERLAVVAPLDGIIIAKHTEVGQWVRQGDPVFEMISTGSIDAVVDVPEKLLHFLEVGSPVEIVVEPLNSRRTGKVHAIIPDGSTAARTFPVKIRLENEKNNQLKAGMSIVASLPTGRKQPTLTVPRDAVVRTAAGASVWVNLDGKAMSIGVRILFGHEDRYAVEPLAGGGPPLMPGMQVVIEGAERLFPTRPLKMIPFSDPSTGQ